MEHRYTFTLVTTEPLATDLRDALADIITDVVEGEDVELSEPINVTEAPTSAQPGGFEYETEE